MPCAICVGKKQYTFTVDLSSIFCNKCPSKNRLFCLIIVHYATKDFLEWNVCQSSYGFAVFYVFRHLASDGNVHFL